MSEPIHAYLPSAIDAMIGLDRPWPLTRVLERLIDATDHLQGVHGCDREGYELDKQAAQRAREIVGMLASPIVSIEV